MVNKERIARKIAQDIQDGMFVNCGHGIPFSVPAYLDPRKKIYIENECGAIGFGLGPVAPFGQYDLLDVANSLVAELPNGAYLDATASFALIRGGHIDITVLGALQVDECANIANWKVPGKPASGIGGAMDLCVGCREVWVAMESTTKEGNPKLLKHCDYPLTAKGVVTRVYTEFGVLTVRPKEGFRLIEIFQDYSVDDVKKLIDPDIEIDHELRPIDLWMSIEQPSTAPEKGDVIRFKF
jgi:3-oxoacid CoA-transferase B subunit